MSHCDQFLEKRRSTARLKLSVVPPGGLTLSFNHLPSPLLPLQHQALSNSRTEQTEQRERENKLKSARKPLSGQTWISPSSFFHRDSGSRGKRHTCWEGSKIAREKSGLKEGSSKGLGFSFSFVRFDSIGLGVLVLAWAREKTCGFLNLKICKFGYS